MREKKKKRGYFLKTHHNPQEKRTRALKNTTTPIIGCGNSGDDITI